MLRRAYLPGLLLSALVFGSGACTVPAMRGIEDLAAIHNPSDWSPRSPAIMSVPPEVYLAERPNRTGGTDRYIISNHRELEHAILKSVATMPREQVGPVMEASAWLAIELLHDDYPEARIQAAAILSSFAGHWIEQMDVRSSETGPAVHPNAYAEAVDRFLSADQAGNYAARLAALDELSNMRAPSALAAVRALTGIGRRLGREDLDFEEQMRALGFALHSVMTFLETASHDSDFKVAEASRTRFELLAKFSRSPVSSTQ
jgi:hypothetical protein